MALIGKDIQQAAQLLTAGELVAIPTETVYGLAANAHNLLAVHRIFEVKNRPFFDPLILHFPTKNSAFESFINVPVSFQKLADAFWPGPLTLVTSKKPHISDLITAGSNLVAVRVPNHKLTLDLLSNIDFPLAAPSANPFGYVSPTQANHVQEQLGDKIPYILDGGNCTVGLESTIIGYREGKLEIWRLGGINQTAIEKVLNQEIPLKIRKHSNPDAPGQIDKHYSTHTPLYIFDSEYLAEKISRTTKSDLKHTALITFGDSNIHPDDFAKTFNLSEKGSLEEAAENFYAALRNLDLSNAQEIWIAWLPNTGLGKAINDRLSRAGKIF